MALSTPTGVLVLAMLVGQAAGFARVPKDAAEKGGDLIPSRMSYSTGSTCTGTDSSTWKDAWGDGCDWYAAHDLGCRAYDDFGQKTNCPVACNHKCFCPPGKVLIDGECTSASQLCDSEFEQCVQKHCGWLLRALRI